MDEIPTSALFVALGFLIVLSAFFSGSETGLMTLNRYRLRHLSRAGHRGARIAERLLKRPDRLIGLVLLGNNFVNILASSLATLIALRLGGEGSLVAATLLLTLAILIFAEVTPKTLAALHPERVAFPAAYVYVPLMRVFYPLVWVVNGIANGLLRLARVPRDNGNGQSLSREELRTVVLEAGAMIPKRHQRMLLNILDLEDATVEDIMVPRNEVQGIDLDDDWDEILVQLNNSQHTRLPVFRDSIDNIVGILHLRKILRAASGGDLDRDSLQEAMQEPYFIPEGTSLQRQLLNFQASRRRIGLVVDEYGDIQGLVTLEDILEEVVGEFTTDPATNQRDIHDEGDGGYLVNGSINIRTLNRALNWQLPTDGPKTLNGLILEHLEAIPEPGTSVKLAGYPVEIIQTRGNAVKTARVRPPLEKSETANE
ncbi:MAG: HlyC/CorC family transporter [Gammaproteobacteria bacterium]